MQWWECWSSVVWDTLSILLKHPILTKQRSVKCQESRAGTALKWCLQNVKGSGGVQSRQGPTAFSIHVAQEVLGRQMCARLAGGTPGPPVFSGSQVWSAISFSQHHPSAGLHRLWKGTTMQVQVSQVELWHCKAVRLLQKNPHTQTHCEQAKRSGGFQNVIH